MEPLRICFFGYLLFVRGECNGSMPMVLGGSGLCEKESAIRCGIAHHDGEQLAQL